MVVFLLDLLLESMGNSSLFGNQQRTFSTSSAVRQVSLDREKETGYKADRQTVHRHGLVRR